MLNISIQNPVKLNCSQKPCQAIFDLELWRKKHKIESEKELKRWEFTETSLDHEEFHASADNSRSNRDLQIPIQKSRLHHPQIQFLRYFPGEAKI